MDAPLRSGVPDDAREKVHFFRIVPDLLDDVPHSVDDDISNGYPSLTVSIDGRKVHSGERIARSDAFGEVSLVFNNGDDNKREKEYIVLMLDPDPPLGLSQIVHFACCNVSPSKPFSSATIKVPYRGPSPPANTGSHRYVFIAWEQPEDFDPDTLDLLPRMRFNVKEWVDSQRLGRAASTTWFTTSFSGCLPGIFSCCVCACCWTPPDFPWDT